MPYGKGTYGKKLVATNEKEKRKKIMEQYSQDQNTPPPPVINKSQDAEQSLDSERKEKTDNWQENKENKEIVSVYYQQRRFIWAGNKTTLS